MSVEAATAARLVELPDPPQLTSDEIAAVAQQFCENLKRTPANKDRALWRDLGCSEIRVGCPLPLGLICDFHRIGVILVPALSWKMPAVAAEFATATATAGDEPAIYIDPDRREFILFHVERNGNLTEFFIAGQLGHLLLHVRRAPVSNEPGGFFVHPKVPEESRRQAAAFARALLMPKGAFEKALKKSGNADVEALSLTFGAPRWAVRRRLTELGHSRLLARLEGVRAGSAAIPD